MFLGVLKVAMNQEAEEVRGALDFPQSFAEEVFASKGDWADC